MEWQNYSGWLVCPNRQSMVFGGSGNDCKADLLDAISTAASLTLLESKMDKKIKQLKSVERPTWYRPYGDEEPFDLGELCHEIAELMERQNNEKIQESVSGELKQ